MIEVHSLSVQFGGVRPLDSLTVSLEGRIVGIVGPNGAGKTTLLNVMSGFVTPASGRIAVDGTDIGSMAPHQRSRWGIRRTFQTEQVSESTSVQDHVAVLLDSCNLTKTERQAAIGRALELTGLTGFASAPSGTLNSYQRRMTELARAVVGKTRVIMMDEPAAGLSEAESVRFRSVLQQIPEATGALVLLIDHDVELISAVCERTMVLDFGRLIAWGPTAQVLEDPMVRAAYLGTEDVVAQ